MKISEALSFDSFFSPRVVAIQQKINNGLIYNIETRVKVIWEKATSISSVMSCHGRHLGFDRTGNTAIRSADPKTPQ